MDKELIEILTKNIDKILEVWKKYESIIIRYNRLVMVYRNIYENGSERLLQKK